MRRLVLVLVVLLSATAHAADPWTYGASEHFEVFTTANAGRAREMLRHFESVHDFLASFILKRPLATATPTRLIIFSNERQFAPYRPAEPAIAFYQPGPDRDHIVMSRFDPTATQIVIHEYVHLILRHTGGRYPVWLNEGLAEFFSTMESDSGRMVIGEAPPGRLQAMLSGTMIPVARLLAVRSDSPEYNTRTHSGTFYAQSWALTHMVLAEETYRAKSDAFLQMIVNGTASAAAFMKVYNKTPEHVERDLRNYLTTTLRVFAPSYKGSPARTAYETRPVPAFEADLVTANLLAVQRNGEAAARAAFTKLEEQQPNDLALLESRGYFELRRGQRATAAVYFARAVERGTRNVALMRDYIMLNPDVAEALVPKALALAPQDVDIRIEEAALLMKKGSHRDALASLAKLPGLTRAQDFRASQLRANLHLQLDNVQEARAASARVTELARNQRERTFATDLRASVDRHAAQKAAFDARARAVDAALEADARMSAAQAREAAATAGRADAPPATPRVEPGEEMVTVAGRIRSVTACTGGRPVLEVLADGRTLKLFVDDPLKVFVRGRATQTVELTCGAQDTPITISYVAAVDKQRGTAGQIRVLDYSR